MSISPANLTRLIASFEPDVDEEREYAEFRERQHKRQPRKSGWAKGQPRCGACRLFIATPTAVCGSCHYDNGAQRFTN